MEFHGYIADISINMCSPVKHWKQFALLRITQRRIPIVSDMNNPLFEINGVTVTCPLCQGRVVELCLKSESWRFFRCRRCGYWTSRGLDYGWPINRYDDAPDFTSSEGDRSQHGDFWQRIMREKFYLAGMKRGSFLDIGCSEGLYVEAAAALAAR